MMNPPPDDNDDNDDEEQQMTRRDAWEVRELLRLLRDMDERESEIREREELARRRAMTDEERIAEDRLGNKQYLKPGSGRHNNANTDKNNHMQRYYHRGAFYMDDDTLAKAADDDVRHRADEYARAATGEDKIDKRNLPKVMQVKKFGLAGYGTKYKGLGKEDTTEKGGMGEVLPLGMRGNHHKRARR
mmetsp:Transcript_14778/g.14968  ORF Transcript_14778/g.14968 Transcript_14778/m.14968 type:complete len:188 (-) Transcript_14778:64-627(-)